MSYFDAFNASESARIPGLLETTNAIQARLNAERKASLEAKAHRTEMDRLAGQRDAVAAGIASDELLRKDMQIAQLEEQLDALSTKNEKWKAAVKQRDEIILEWMQSTEGFKRLAKQYGKQLGLTQEQRQIDFDNHAIQVAKDDSDFANTGTTQRAKERLGIK